ncbi:phosphoserine phosphatase [Basfia succiniciproducens]|uniref:phosphoserine phosphatase n=1 Tax=Basfia succiniciproducens TaxID=653940 RepID=UPI003FCD8DA1
MQTSEFINLTLKDIKQHYSPFPNKLINNQPQTEDRDYFILFGTNLEPAKLQAFQQKCGENFQIFDCWNNLHNIVVLLKGHWQKSYETHAHDLTLDAAKIDFNANLAEQGLLVMDMDSTAIQIECIDEIAKLAGTGEEVSAITAAAMRGELDFEQSLRRRVSTLKDAPETILQEVRLQLPLMPGLKETVRILQQHNWRVAIASGGFTYFADYLKELLNLDAAVSNQFDIENGKLTGRVKGDIVHAQYKADTLKRLAREFNIPLENTVAIGDGANDLLMLKQANLGAAFHAKPKVQQQAQVVVNFADLTALLCLLSAGEKIKHLS